MTVTQMPIATTNQEPSFVSVNLDTLWWMVFAQVSNVIAKSDGEL
jgi:hypothetical protein